MLNPYVYAGLVTLIEDTFTAADATSISGRTPSPTNIPGNNWVTQLFTFTVSSNRMGASNANSRAAIDAGVANCTVSCRLLEGSTNIRRPGLMFRANTSTAAVTDAATSHWYVDLINGTGVVLVERNAGVPTTRASSGKTIALNTEYLVEVILLDDSITVKVEGVVECSYNSSFQQTATRHGLINVGTSTTGVRQDDFKVTVP